VGKAAAVKVEAESTSLKADNRDLCYFDITVTDENGDRIPDAAHELQCLVEGGTLMGIFSGDPCNEDAYGSDTCHAFQGRALAIIRTNTPGEIKVTVRSLSLTAGFASVIAE
jgi:beta-galactosidase